MGTPVTSDRSHERLHRFDAGAVGAWRIVHVAPVAGESLQTAERLDVHFPGDVLPSDAATPRWSLTGVSSHERYTTRDEKTALLAQQPPLGRASATCAALIPIRKNAAWWALTQDERRAILEERSHHIAAGMSVLPAVARRLVHCRDLGSPQPFDFLTWFEYAPEHADAFEQLVATLRATEEWRFVDREVDVRLARESR